MTDPDHNGSAQHVDCVTWNVHRARGQDGTIDPDRVARALETEIAPLQPQILALQEADGECRPHAAILDVARIETATGLLSVHTQRTLRWGPLSDGFLGTILFVHPKFKRKHEDVIDLPGHCHRGAVSVELDFEGQKFRVMSMHLSLGQPLRILQMRILGQYLRRRPKMQTLLLGDLNEWRPWGGFAFANKVVGTKLTGPVRATFPARYPVLPLDRILSDHPGAVTKAQTLKTPLVRFASDHCPLRARVKIA